MHQLYSDSPGCIIVIFDLRYPDTKTRLRRERVGWGSFADVGSLDADHVALIIRPGGPLRLR